MPIHRCYVRGHGGIEETPLPRSKDIPIDLITLGQQGCNMSDEVAEAYINNYVDTVLIKHQIDHNVVIYWTKQQRDNWYSNHVLNFIKPPLTTTPYGNLDFNLALYGDDKIGKCGVFHYDNNKPGLELIIPLQNNQKICVSEIIDYLSKMLNDESDTIELYWTACMSDKYWFGNNKKVSFNPMAK